ncbi:VOC family protein [Desulfovibrio sp. Huiquan2017]|uniref:VOC family protein n=1 Tax=Desulfovibrio sp. Huiquan2017 TaxID=2816861 RepID=UPI001A92731E|nr:VOC family protein [Desulfovibrio sp. Huiquan2017]
MLRLGYSRLILIPALLGLLLPAACSTRIALPSVTPDAGRLSYPGKFVWFDLHTTDMYRVAQFYDAVFGWSVERADPGSPRIKTILRSGRRIGSIFLLDDKDRTAPGWVPNLAVSDADAAFAGALAAGASPLYAPGDRPYRGRMAGIRDPQGARLVLLASSSGDPRDGPPEDGTFMGAELWTPDVTGAEAFYVGLAGYRAVEIGSGGAPYVMLLSDERPRGGITAPPAPVKTPLWVPQVAVRDVMGVLERVRAAGGTVLLCPVPGDKTHQTAVFLDPAGGVMGVRAFAPVRN